MCEVPVTEVFVQIDYFATCNFIVYFLSNPSITTFSMRGAQ